MRNISYFSGSWFLLYAVVIAFTLCFSVTAGAKKELPPVGSIKIDDTQISFIVGGSWGRGILSYKGVDYAFKIKGLKVGAIGVSKVSAVGNVYNMSDLSKFSGTYVAGQVGGTVLDNQNNVYIRLGSTQKGVALNIGIDGLTIELQDAVGPTK